MSTYYNGNEANTFANSQALPGEYNVSDSVNTMFNQFLNPNSTAAYNNVNWHELWVNSENGNGYTCHNYIKDAFNNSRTDLVRSSLHIHHLRNNQDCCRSIDVSVVSTFVVTIFLLFIFVMILIVANTSFHG